MNVFGLTGGVGMGKSAAADLLRARGVPVVDTDDLAHELVKPGQPALKEIEKEFGKKIIAADGGLLRNQLAEVVFANPSARSRLEAILHPRISGLWQEQVRQWGNAGRPVAVVVIPLLFETRVEGEFSSVICVACSAETQQKRLLVRGWTLREIEQRNAAQLPIEQKIVRSQHVVWNEGSLDVLADQLSKIISAP